MSSREEILGRIRAALQSDTPPDRPPVPEVWARTSPTTDEMAARFVEEIEGVAGEVHRCASVDDARRKLGEILGKLEPAPVGVVDHPLARELTSDLPSDRVDLGTSDGEVRELAQWSASVIVADCLLADTGTCMAACATPRERLMCYLPPVSIVVARENRLFEHLPAAWEELAPRVADPELRGEFVFITGPSRTADIEKILILGAHGPKRLVVLLVE